jgi:hypothetical protein
MASDEFQARARDCIRRALVATTKNDKAILLGMAEAWLRLAHIDANAEGRPSQQSAAVPNPKRQFS